MHFVKWLKIQIDANLFITVSQLQVAFVCQQQFYISFFPPPCLNFRPLAVWKLLGPVHNPSLKVWE